MRPEGSRRLNRLEGFGAQFGYCKDFEEGLYLVGQRFFIRGLTAGGTKG